MGTQQNQNELKEECIRFKRRMKQCARILCLIISTWDPGTTQPSQPHSSVTFLLNMTVAATLSLTDAMSNISAFIIQLIFKPLVTEPQYSFHIIKPHTHTHTHTHTIHKSDKQQRKTKLKTQKSQKSRIQIYFLSFFLLLQACTPGAEMSKSQLGLKGKGREGLIFPFLFVSAHTWEVQTGILCLLTNYVSHT